MIPSLASFPEQKSVDDIVAKVLVGRSSMSGMMGMRRTTMPVFPYLDANEIFAAYLYLATYQPRS